MSQRTSNENFKHFKQIIGMVKSTNLCPIHILNSIKLFVYKPAYVCIFGL